MSSDPQDTPAITRADEARRRLVTDLRAVADFLEDNPAIPPLSGSCLRVHVTSDEFIAAARAMDGDIDVNGRYVLCSRAFGCMALGVQTYRPDLLGEEPEPDVSDRVRALIEGQVAA